MKLWLCFQISTNPLIILTKSETIFGKGNHLLCIFCQLFDSPFDSLSERRLPFFEVELTPFLDCPPPPNSLPRCMLFGPPKCGAWQYVILGIYYLGILLCYPQNARFGVDFWVLLFLTLFFLKVDTTSKFCNQSFLPKYAVFGRTLRLFLLCLIPLSGVWQRGAYHMGSGSPRQGIYCLGVYYLGFLIGGLGGSPKWEDQPPFFWVGVWGSSREPRVFFPGACAQGIYCSMLACNFVVFSVFANMCSSPKNAAFLAYNLVRHSFPYANLCGCTYPKKFWNGIHSNKGSFALFFFNQSRNPAIPGGWIDSFFFTHFLPSFLL